MLPQTPAVRRTVLAVLSLVLAVAGAETFAWSGGTGETIADLWLPVVLISTVPPALSAALHGRRWMQRSACWFGIVVTGLVALVLFPYGYGILQIPAVVALAFAAATRG